MTKHTMIHHIMYIPTPIWGQKIWPTAHSHMIQMYVHIFKRANPLVQTSLVHSTHQSGSQTTDTLIRRVSGPRKCAEPERVKVKVNNDRVALSWNHINNWRTGFVWVELCAYSIIYNSTWTNIEYKCESFHFSYGFLMEISLMIACHVKLWNMQLSWIFFSKNV